MHLKNSRGFLKVEFWECPLPIFKYKNREAKKKESGFVLGKASINKDDQRPVEV